MTHPPYQMNQPAAAKHCGVSVDVFKRDYREHLNKRVVKGHNMFLRSDIEKHLRSLYQAKVEPTPINNATKNAKPQKKKTGFNQAVQAFKQEA